MAFHFDVASVDVLQASFCGMDITPCKLPATPSTSVPLPSFGSSSLSPPVPTFGAPSSFFTPGAVAGRVPRKAFKKPEETPKTPIIEEEFPKLSIHITAPSASSSAFPPPPSFSASSLSAPPFHAGVKETAGRGTPRRQNKNTTEKGGPSTQSKNINVKIHTGKTSPQPPTKNISFTDLQLQKLVKSIAKAFASSARAEMHATAAQKAAISANESLAKIKPPFAHFSFAEPPVTFHFSAPPPTINTTTANPPPPPSLPTHPPPPPPSSHFPSSSHWNPFSSQTATTSSTTTTSTPLFFPPTFDKPLFTFVTPPPPTFTSTPFPWFSATTTTTSIPLPQHAFFSTTTTTQPTTQPPPPTFSFTSDPSPFIPNPPPPAQKPSFLPDSRPPSTYSFIPPPSTSTEPSTPPPPTATATTATATPPGMGSPPRTVFRARRSSVEGLFRKDDKENSKPSKSTGSTGKKKPSPKDTKKTAEKNPKEKSAEKIPKEKSTEKTPKEKSAAEKTPKEKVPKENSKEKQQPIGESESEEEERFFRRPSSSYSSNNTQQQPPNNNNNNNNNNHNNGPVGIDTWSTKQLIKELTKLGVVTEGCLEKSELIQKIRQYYMQTFEQRKAEANKQRVKAATEQRQKDTEKTKEKIILEVATWAKKKSILQMLNDLSGKKPNEPGYLRPADSMEVVAKAYKKALLQIHPDKHMGDELGHVRATERFKFVHEAMEAYKASAEKKQYFYSAQYGFKPGAKPKASQFW